MPFIIQLDCPCCRDLLWHCKKCWDRFHNGQKHNDYTPPKFYGQSMFNREAREKGKEFNLEFPSFEDPKREYKEGEYH